MNIQVLVATMHQKDYSLLEKMNIQTDAIVGNQCDHNSIEQFKWKDHEIKYLNFAERGVGLNRNNALMRADAEICLFADDDIVFLDDYPKIVEAAFREHPEADVLIFNIDEPYKNVNERRYVIKKYARVHYLNYMRYGTVRIAVRLRRVKEKGIYFNQMFGGGTEYCHGEDTLFLTSCLKNGLKIYAVPQTISVLKEDRESTWNNGYDKKYLLDQGKLYSVISIKWWRLLCIQDALRRYKSYGLSVCKAYKTMISGVKRN